MLTNTLQWLFEYRWWKDDIRMKHEWKKQYIGSDILKDRWPGTGWGRQIHERLML